MAVRALLANLWTWAWPRASVSRARSESDVSDDVHTATTRVYGGVDEYPEHNSGDAESTTGPGKNGLFVGRTAGQDIGYAGQTGAEARAQDRDET